jgi:hypothetical protein
MAEEERQKILAEAAANLREALRRSVKANQKDTVGKAMPMADGGWFYTQPKELVRGEDDIVQRIEPVRAPRLLLAAPRDPKTIN